MNEEFEQKHLNGESSENSGWYQPSARVQQEENRYSPVAQPKKKKGGAGKVIALALVCALLGSGAGAGTAAAICNANRSSDVSTIYVSDVPHRNVVTAIVPGTETPMSDAEIYAANAVSTVGIRTQVTTTNFFGWTTTGAASGSGFVLSEDGYIITNYHVVEGANAITVITFDNETHEAALIGFDERNDVAVLKIEASDLTPVVLGSSDSLNVGDHVIAIGNPLGELTFSLTQGAVSAMDRQITVSTGVTMKLIQTDCAINSGNSGGALFNVYGEVVGITNAKYSSSSSGTSVDNIGFAIPIDSVEDIIKQIIQSGVIERPYIGVSVVTVSSEAQGYGIPAGASIQVVNEDSPAEAAGLEINDIITAVNGEPISSSGELTALIAKCSPGDELTLSVYRNGDIIELDIIVGANSHNALEPTAAPQQQKQQSQQFPGFFGSWPFG